MFADTKLEVALMISSQLDANFNVGIHLVSPNDHPATVAPTVFVRTRLEIEIVTNRKERTLLQYESWSIPIGHSSSFN